MYWLFSLPPLVGVLVYALIIIFFKDHFLSFYESPGLLSQYCMYIIPMVFFSSTFGILASFISAAFDTVFASFLQDILLRIIVILDLVLFAFELISFDMFIMIFVANFGLQYLLLLTYAFRNGYLNLTIDRAPFDTDLFRRVRNFSLFSFFNGFTLILVSNIDLIMVDVFEGLEITGIYAIGLYVGSVISIPRKSIAKISLPVITNAFSNNDLSAVHKVYRQTAINQFIAGILIYIGVLANMENLYSLLPPEYATGGIVIMIIGLGHLFDMVNGVNGQVIISSRYYKFDFYAAMVLVIVSVMLNLLLIPKYGMMGAATATAASLLVYNTIKTIYVWFRLKIQPFSFRHIGVLLSALGVYFLSLQIPFAGQVYLDIILRSTFITLLFGSAILIFNLSSEVRELARSIAGKVFKNS